MASELATSFCRVVCRRLPDMLKQRLWGERFLKRLVMLTGATLIGQLAFSASAPLLTRLFTPESFGAFGLFAALTGIAASVATLRYEFAIPFAADEQEAEQLLAVMVVSATFWALILLPLLWLWADPLAALFGVPALAAMLPWLSLALLLWGLAAGFNHLAIRHRHYRRVSLSQAGYLLAQSLAQLLAGVLGAGVTGLVIGFLCGQIARITAHYGSHLPRRLLRALRTPAACWRTALRHRRYAFLTSPAMLLQNTAQYGMVLLVLFLYGPGAGGLFVLAQRMLDAPVRLVGNTASLAYLGEIAGGGRDDVAHVFRRTARRFALLGGLGLLPVCFFGPELFALFFGPAWERSGEIARMLVPMQLMRFTVIPVSQTVNRYGRQDLQLRAAGSGLCALLASFAVGWHWRWPLEATLLLFSVTLAVIYGLWLQGMARLVREMAAA